MSTNNGFAFPVDISEEEKLEKFRTAVEGLANELLVSPTDTPYLLGILRHKKGDVEKSLEFIIFWWKNRDRLDHIYQKIYPSLHLAQYGENRQFRVLSNLDKEGRTVIIWNGDWGSSQASLMDMVISKYALYDVLTRRQSFQLNGLVQINDFSRLRFPQLQLLGPSTIRDLVAFFETLPIKHKATHFVNHGVILHAVYQAGKIFLKDKLKKRIHFHGNDLKSLHKFLDPAILPVEYGGNLSNDSDWEEVEIIQEMIEREAHYKELLDKSKFGIRAVATN